MTLYLNRDDIIAISMRVSEGRPMLRDVGLLDSAIGRPQSSAFGQDAYPTLHLKAAALLHSLARNHPFEDGNKRTAWAAAWLFLGYNGVQLGSFDVNEAEAFMYDVAADRLELSAIAMTLESFAAPGAESARR